MRDIQSHPTTGTAHNKQLISTQVEAIFMLDSLKSEMKKLRRTVVSLDKQSRRLEIATIALGVIALIIALVQVIPILQGLL